MKNRTCTIPACAKPYHGRGWCITHYGKWRKTGDQNYTKPTFEERLFGKIDFSGVCWEWIGAKGADGYGTFHLRPGKWQRPHRAVWEFLVGKLDDDLQLDHLCRNPSCVNPDHLEPVPAWVNNMRSYSATAILLRREWCTNGHLLDDANTYWRPDGKGRHCLECRRARDRARVRDRRKAPAAA